MDELVENNFKTLAIRSNCIYCRLRTRHMPVMIGTPYVDHNVKTSLNKLVIMVRNIAREVSRFSVTANQYFVLFTSEVSSAEPLCSFLFDGVAAIPKKYHGRFKAGNGITICIKRTIEGCLRLPMIVVDV